MSADKVQAKKYNHVQGYWKIGANVLTMHVSHQLNNSLGVCGDSCDSGCIFLMER